MNIVTAPRAIYQPKKLGRDTQVRTEFRQEKAKSGVENEVYVLDIIRGSMIQLYEQRQNDISKAQAGTLQSLARALGCEMQDLME